MSPFRGTSTGCVSGPFLLTKGKQPDFDTSRFELAQHPVAFDSTNMVLTVYTGLTRTTTKRGRQSNNTQQGTLNRTNHVPACVKPTPFRRWLYKNITITPSTLFEGGGWAYVWHVPTVRPIQSHQTALTSYNLVAEFPRTRLEQWRR